MALRVSVGAVVAVSLIARPVHLASFRWWRSHEVATAIGLSSQQRTIIDRIYDEQLRHRQQCVERIVEETNRLDQLVREGVYDDDVLRQTQALEEAATEERSVRLGLNDAIVGVLDANQRRTLADLLDRRFAQ